MATQIVQWKSADGQMFDTEAAADEHDLRQNLIENLFKMMGRYDVTAERDETFVNMIFDFLEVNKEVLKDYLFPELYY